MSGRASLRSANHSTDVADVQNCRLTIVQFGVDNNGSDVAGCFVMEIKTDATKFTDMKSSRILKVMRSDQKK